MIPMGMVIANWCFDNKESDCKESNRAGINQRRPSPKKSSNHQQRPKNNININSRQQRQDKPEGSQSDKYKDGSENVSYNSPGLKHRTRQIAKPKENQKQNNRQSQSYLPVGLPNVGNTCFLNSLLQFLFGAQLFREQLIKIANRHSQTSSIYLIGRLFELMKQRRQDKTSVTRLLIQLMKKIESINLHYQRYRQQDVFETMSNILQDIDTQYKIKYMFNVRFSVKCLCYNRKAFFSQTYFIQEEKKQYCSYCKYIFIKEYTITPRYLIVFQCKTYQETLRIAQDQYKFVSKVLYFGSGKHGHYTCVRGENQKYYLFNDSSVTPCDFNGNSNHSTWSTRRYLQQNTYIALYAKIQKKSSNCQFISENERKMNLTKMIEQPQIKLLYNDIYLNKIYKTTIQVASRVFIKNKQFASKPRDIYFKVQKYKRQLPNQLVILNSANFIYYSRQKFNKDHDIWLALNDDKHQYIPKTLRYLIETIQKKFNQYFKQEIKVRNFDVLKVPQYIKLVNVAASNPFNSQNLNVEQIQFQSS